MTKRNPVAIILFTVLTLGLYAYYWLYATSEELRRESGRRDIHPLIDAVLAFLSAGIWGIYAGWRNARLARELLEERGLEARDRSVAVAVAGAASFVVGPWAWLVAIVMLQEELNRLAEPIDVFAPAPRVRVEVERPEREPMPARSDVEVFTSSAPAPNVY